MIRTFLAIDASTRAGTCAVVRSDGAVVSESAAELRTMHEELLMPAVVRAIELARISPAAIGGIVCGSGPGSFTGLRIAAAIAKGLASGWAVPLFPVSSLLLTAASAVPPLPAGRFVAAMDALRGEYYALICDVDSVGVLRASGDVRIVSREALRAGIVPGADGARCVGPDCELAANPHARAVAALMPAVLSGPGFDPSEWEPHYGRLSQAEARLGRS